jgi:hypothetical protein
VVFWLYINASEKHAASIFRVKVRRVRMLIAYIEVGRGLGQGGQEDGPITAMGGGGGGEMKGQ